MKFIFLVLIILPNVVLAHCPISLDINTQSYCADIKWLNGETKDQGKLNPSDELSPALIPMGQVPQKWIYSKAEINIWNQEDHSHTPVKIEDLRIFPYMVMANGHHHGGSYNFSWDVDSENYKISEIPFQGMPGCWSLRWTTSQDESFINSEHLIDVQDYANLSADENSKMSEYCENTNTSAGDHKH